MRINPLLQVHVDGVIAVLDANRGCWGQGMHFGGGYEVVYGPIRQGGRRVNQSAKISFAVETSVE